MDVEVLDRDNGMPNIVEEKGFQNVHMVLEALLKAIPLLETSKLIYSYVIN